MFEPNDLERLLLDNYFLGLALEADDEDVDEDYGDAWDEDEDEDEDGVAASAASRASSLEALARWVADIEAGRAQLPPGWKLSRPKPGTVVWIAPSGEHYMAALPGPPPP
jgi:hypothetical protein